MEMHLNNIQMQIGKHFKTNCGWSFETLNDQREMI